MPAERLPEPVEAAAYFVVAEALTNVAKYANANAATVAVDASQRARRASRSPTTASAAPIPAAARACAASPTASAHWTVPGTRLPSRVGHYSPSGDPRMSTSDTA